MFYDKHQLSNQIKFRNLLKAVFRVSRMRRTNVEEIKKISLFKLAFSILFISVICKQFDYIARPQEK